MLKKSLFGLVALVLLFGVASCFSSNNESPVVNKLNQSEGLSLSTYLASGFLQTGKKNDNQTLEIEISDAQIGRQQKRLNLNMN